MSVKFYSKREEALNIWSHALGLMLSIVGLGLMLLKASTMLSIMASIIFGVSLITLYAASTLYHKATDPATRTKLRIFDHAAIYVLIAGTYTPFAIITLKDSGGTTILIIIWSIAVVGVGLKLFFTGRFTIFSTLLYVGMGWVGVFYGKSLMASLDPEGVNLIFAGGVSYTLGAILYAIKKIPYNHAIFHFFVLAGSLLHFLSIYWFVI